MTYPVPEHATVDATPGGRLEQLAAEYARIKPAFDAAEDHLKAVIDAIKLELTYAAPGSTKVDLKAPALDRPLRLMAKTSWRLDTKKMKAEDPATYARYAVQNTCWELRAVTGGGGK